MPEATHSASVGELHDQVTFGDDINRALFIVVMGVSGTGKSTLGAALSRAFRLPFIDGDDLHPPSNIAKMSRGEPLTDDDRQPWLDTIRGTAVQRILGQLGVHIGDGIKLNERAEAEKTTDEFEQELATSPASEGQPSLLSDEERRPGVIVACSALKRKYREVLRGSSSITAESQPDGVSVPVYFVHLSGSKDILMDRMHKRQGHFMKALMLESQLNTLESPEGEPGVITIAVEWPTEEQVRHVSRTLGLKKM
ncbi:hypothetical protein ID866_2473 [Astraeus odoratus]|nr:hypothetical protein ID866_2473 [Astraeus odoratus]